MLFFRLCWNPHTIFVNAPWGYGSNASAAVASALERYFPGKYYNTIAKRWGGLGGQALSPPIPGDSHFVDIVGFQQSLKKSIVKMQFFLWKRYF